MSIRQAIISPYVLAFGLTLFPAVASAGDSVTYVYDSNGRIHTITYANGTVTTYTYDTAGNRQTVVITCSGSGC